MCARDYRRSNNVLILDDEPLILDIFSDYLASMGVNVQTAKSINDARRYLDFESYDLILTDVVIKAGCFSTFLNYVRGSSRHSNTPTIAITGAPDSISSQDRSQLDGILEKPFTPDELYSGISEFLSN